MSSDSEKTEVNSLELREVIMKLLDRAGKNPRLTARLLREKAEEKLQLNKNSLKTRRPEIKDMIEVWWKKNMLTEDVDEELNVLKRLVRYAKAVGKGPMFFKGLSDIESNAEKAGFIRKR
jgi:hypothetical protein